MEKMMSHKLSLIKMVNLRRLFLNHLSLEFSKPMFQHFPERLTQQSNNFLGIFPSLLIFSEMKK